MAIELTTTAAERIRSFVARDGGVGLRLGVKKTGCSGWAYTVDLAREVLEDDIVIDTDALTVSVFVRRNSERGNAIPTFFARVFGIDEVGVAATATAEVTVTVQAAGAHRVRWPAAWAVSSTDIPSSAVTCLPSIFRLSSLIFWPS